MKTAAKKNSSSRSSKDEASFFHNGNGSSLSTQSESGFFSHSVCPSPAVQAKLSVGQPDDEYEREADATADKVVQRLASTSESKKANNDLQSKPLTFQSSVAEETQVNERDEMKEEKKQKRQISRLQKKP